MAKNANLTAAKKAKNDEFYTQITDIEKELVHYHDQLRGKIIFCNCDDPTYSNFWRYFHLNFAKIGLKKLVSTHFDPEKPTYKLEYEGGNDGGLERRAAHGPVGERGLPVTGVHRTAAGMRRGRDESAFLPVPGVRGAADAIWKEILVYREYECYHI